MKTDDQISEEELFLKEVMSELMKSNYNNEVVITETYVKDHVVNKIKNILNEKETTS